MLMPDSNIIDEKIEKMNKDEKDFGVSDSEVISEDEIDDQSYETKVNSNM